MKYYKFGSSYIMINAERKALIARVDFFDSTEIILKNLSDKESLLYETKSNEITEAEFADAFLKASAILTSYLPVPASTYEEQLTEALYDFQDR